MFCFGTNGVCMIFSHSIPPGEVTLFCGVLLDIMECVYKLISCSTVV